MNKTNAIKTASTYVCAPRGSRLDWYVIGPYHYDHPHGPTTEQRACSYARARAIRTLWVAQVALTLMGRSDLVMRADCIAYESGWRGMTVCQLINDSIDQGDL